VAGKYGIKVIADGNYPRIASQRNREALHQTGNATGVMLQIGTRNKRQNFELLKIVGRGNEMPILLKRGFRVSTLDESLNAAEYLASEGNRNVVFGLRGMKTNMGDPHRQLCRFRRMCGGQAPDQDAGMHRPVALGGVTRCFAGRHPRHDARHRPSVVGRSPTWCLSIVPPSAPPKALGRRPGKRCC